MISINWLTRVIYVPLAYLTSLGGGIYELDTNQFHLDLKDLEDSEDGIIFPDTHTHNTEAVLSGTTYARQIQIKNGYTVEFEAGSYSVKCVGSNHNIGDVKVVNSVSLIIGNSAGLIVGSGGGAVTPADIDDIKDAVWDEVKTSHNGANTFGKLLKDMETAVATIKTLTYTNLK